MVLDGQCPTGGVGVAQVAFAVTHDEQAADAPVVGPLPEVVQVAFVPGVAEEERVAVLDRVDAVVASRRPREIQRVQRPLQDRVRSVRRSELKSSLRGPKIVRFNDHCAREIRKSGFGPPTG